MESVTSAEELDELSDRLETYSADVSALESCSRYSHDPDDDADCANSLRSSTSAECCLSSKFSFPAVCVSHVLSPSTASEVELMKERFAKLLLGEDLSVGGKGVCTALAISNAISDLSGFRFIFSLHDRVFASINLLNPINLQLKSSGICGSWNRCHHTRNQLGGGKCRGSYP